MLLPFFFGRDGLQIFVGFNDGTVDFFGNGQYFFYITDEFIVLCHFTLVFELKRFEYIDGRKFYVWNRIAVINAHGGEVDTSGHIGFGLSLGMAGQASQ